MYFHPEQVALAGPRDPTEPIGRLRVLVYLQGTTTPVPGARIVVRLQNASGATVASAVVGNEGAVTFELPFGVYFIRAGCDRLSYTTLTTIVSVGGIRTLLIHLVPSRQGVVSCIEPPAPPPPPPPINGNSDKDKGRQGEPGGGCEYSLDSILTCGKNLLRGQLSDCCILPFVAALAVLSLIVFQFRR